MAERNPGPVKPPTIDLVAREAVESPAPSTEPEAPAEPAVDAAETLKRQPRVRKAKPEVEAGAPPAVEPEPMPRAAEPPHEPPRPAPPPPRLEPVHERPQTDWGQIGAAALIGALFGTALTYVVATIIPMPSCAPIYADPGPALADQSSRLDGIDQRLGTLEESAVDTQMSLDATITQLDTSLNGVRQELAAAQAAAEAAVPPPVDTSALEERMRALSARLDAVAAGASSADAGALAENLADLERELLTIRSSIATTNQRLDALEPGVAALGQRLDSVPVLPPGPSISDVALNGLEAAFAAGRPFASELEALSRATPGVVVPLAIDELARRGLPAPDALGDRFAAIVPEMLAARRPAADAGWQDNAVDWLEGLLAIRPAGEVEGDAPDAVLARLEAAMERRDFVAAADLFARLPPEMRAAAGNLPDDVKLQAEAAVWVASLRGTPTEVTQ